MTFFFKGDDMKKHILTLISCGFMASTAMANPLQTIEQSKQCSSISFQLPANPTTGYSWQVVDYNQTRFQKEKATFVAPKTKRIGAGGMMTFNFKKIEKDDSGKDAVFLLAYGQAWNKQSYNNTVVIVNFVDKPCKQ
jgi:predicted secreted protein